MNLFILSECPTEAARMQANKHIVKMCEETGNIILWPFKLLNIPLPSAKSGLPKKLSHANHPASRWARESRQNFLWTLKHLVALCAEYSARYGRKHFAETYIAFVRENYAALDRFGFISEGLTPFARCFGPYKETLENGQHQTPNTVEAYRLFYKWDKETFAAWPHKIYIPAWWWESKGDKYVDPSFTNGIYKKGKGKKKIEKTVDSSTAN